MRVYVVWGAVLAILLYCPHRASAGSAASPVGTWQTSIKGTDPGVAYLTFSNDFSFVGYGFSRRSFGMFGFVGTWGNNSAGQVVAGFTQDFIDGSEAGSFKAKVSGNSKKLSARAKGSIGRLRLLGAPESEPIADISGDWTSRVTVEGRHHFESYTLAASTNLAGVFDVSGTGLDDTGSFTISGAMIVNSRNQVAGFTANDYGAVEVTNSVMGRVVRKGRRLALKGHQSTGGDVKIQAEK
jgi:hypothetical protein